MTQLLANYLSESELAAELGVTVRSVQLWRQKRQGPPWTKLGQRVFYRRSAFTEWLLSREQRPVRER